MVNELTEENSFSCISEMTNNSSPLNVLYFTATWCGPCKMIAPHVNTLSQKYSNINFYKIDVDEFEHLTEEAGISCMPTFQFYKNNQLVEKMEGADGVRLENLVIQHM